MNIKYHRISLNESEWINIDGEGKMVKCFSDAKKFNTVGNSVIYVATANMDIGEIIKKGDLVFFKANNSRGVNGLGRTEESFGSCEDVAEVFGYTLLKNLKNDIGEKCVLEGTPYGFSEYSDDAFWSVIANQTNGLVESSRLYGCVSPNVVSKNGVIIHGDSLLELVVDSKRVYASTQNNLANYNKSLEEFVIRAKKFNQDTVISPNCIRYLANTMFFDYFIANSDRHCKNVNFQHVKVSDNMFVLEPIPVLDNGGALSLQAMRCNNFYAEQAEVLNQKGKFTKSNGVKEHDPFDCMYDFEIGKESFKDEKIKELFDSMTYEEKMVILITQNKVLYEDFKNMYENLDFEKAVSTMISTNKYSRDYLPEFTEIVKAVLNLKKREICKVCANVLGIDFSEEKFNENPNYYLEELGNIVQENELNLYIATNEEQKEFANAIKLAKKLEN